MRTLTLTMGSLLFSLLMIFTSCSKEMETLNPQSEVSQEFFSELEDLANTYSSGTNTRWWPLVKMALKDGMAGGAHHASGFCEGGFTINMNDEFTHSGGGVIESSCNGSCIGVGAMTSFLAAYEDTTQKINNVDTYFERTIQNPKNSFETAGSLHNKFILNSVSEFRTNGNDVYQAIIKTCFNNNKFITRKDFQNRYTSLITATNNLDFENFIKNTTSSKSLTQILNIYVNGMLNLSSNSACVNYTVAFENLIVSNKQLNKKAKEAILITTSIAKHSLNLWSSILD